MTYYALMLRYTDSVSYSQSYQLKHIIINCQMIQQELQLKEGMQVMTQEHLEQVKEILTNAFLENNQIWKALYIKRDDIVEFFNRTMRSHLDSQNRSRQRFGPNVAHDFIWVRDGKIISSIHHYELEDFKNMKKSEKPEKLQLFKDLEKEGKQLIKAVDLSAYPPGSTVYVNFGGTNPQYIVTGLQKLIIFMDYHIRLKQAGFKWVIGRLSNERAALLYKKIGAKILKEIRFERNGKEFPLFFFEIDIHSETFNNLEKNLEKLKQQDRQITLAKQAKAKL